MTGPDSLLAATTSVFGSITATNVAWILALIIALAWVLYAFANQRSARPELGSEVELAANRKPYLSDEELEGKRLELVQFIGVLLLVVVVIGLPLYWMLEPHRQVNAEENMDNIRAGWGSNLFASTANGGFNCAGCHGENLGGGNAQSTVTDPVTGEVRQVNFSAPALNNISYRYSYDEIFEILVYGRPGTPMPAWGLEGGGPMNDQQLETIIEYMYTQQIAREDCSAEEAGDTMCPTGHLPDEDNETNIEATARQLVADGVYDSYGEALFNLPFGGGSYSCARCHTPGWNYGDPGAPGSGRLGPNLTGGTVNVRFADQQEFIDFLASGSDKGVGYGDAGSQGSGRMPAFGATHTPEQLEAIAEYVEGL